MMKHLQLFALLLIMATVTTSARAEEVNFNKVLDSVKEGASVRSETGEIYELDLVRRTAVIGGFMYLFGPSTLADPIEVTMLGSDYGALELLRVGMFVEVSFLPSSSFRIGKQIVQVTSIEES